MTPSILRAVLAVAVLLGVGIIFNIFNNHQPGGDRSRAAGLAGRPVLVQQGDAAPAETPEAGARRVAGAVRRELEVRGYLKVGQGLAVDPALRAAILAFEFDYKLPMTATPSERVLKALIFAQTAQNTGHGTVPDSTEARNLIEQVQRALAHLGYARAAYTGELDPETRKAIGKFERARGLQVSGRVSAPLIESLGPAFDSAAAQTDVAAKNRTAG